MKNKNKDWLDEVLEKDKSNLIGDVLMAVIYNEVESYDEKREPTRWKVSSEKLYKFVNSLLQKERQRICKELEGMKEKNPGKNKLCYQCGRLHCGGYGWNKALTKVIQKIDEQGL